MTNACDEGEWYRMSNIGADKPHHRQSRVEEDDGCRTERAGAHRGDRNQ